MYKEAMDGVHMYKETMDVLQWQACCVCCNGTRPHGMCQPQAGGRPCVRRSHRGRGRKGCCHEDLSNLMLLPQQGNLYWRLPILILGRQGHVRESLRASARKSLQASAHVSPRADAARATCSIVSWREAAATTTLQKSLRIELKQP